MFSTHTKYMIPLHSTGFVIPYQTSTLYYSASIFHKFIETKYTCETLNSDINNEVTKNCSKRNVQKFRMVKSLSNFVLYVSGSVRMDFTVLKLHDCVTDVDSKCTDIF